MRRSHEGLSGITKDNYLGLPQELDEFSYYYNDGETGHVIMAVPECLLEEALSDGDLDMYECPFPAKYVIKKGYRMVDGHVVCDGRYDSMFGLDIDSSWYEL